MVFQGLPSWLHQALAAEHDQEPFCAASLIAAHLKGVFVPRVIPELIGDDAHAVRGILELMVFIAFEFPFSEECYPFLFGFLRVVEVILEIGLRDCHRCDADGNRTDSDEEMMFFHDKNLL